MGIDLEKLTPADWSSVQAVYPDSLIPTKQYILAHGLKQLATFESETDCDFAALARRAFDIMLRRGPDFFLLERSESDGKIIVDCPSYGWIPGRWDDPFSAWDEAEKFYAANVEGKTDE